MSRLLRDTLVSVLEKEDAVDGWLAKLQPEGWDNLYALKHALRDTTGKTCSALKQFAHLKKLQVSCHDLDALYRT